MIDVHVTGAGLLSPAGSGRLPAYSSMLTGIPRARRIERFDTSQFKCKIAVPIDGLVMRPSVNDRYLEMALRVAEEALGEAGLTRDNVSMGIVFATAIGATERMEYSFRFRTKPNSEIFRFDMPTEILADEFSIGGLQATITTGCTASIDALGYAYDAISQGICERILVVTSEAPIVPITLAAFDRIGAISRFVGDPGKASRPFHKERDGFVLGEGAAAVVIESGQSARNRGVSSLIKIAGWGSVSSGYHMTAIRTSGEDIARAIEIALSDSKIKKDGIDLIDLHATSTKMNDLAESNALLSVFGASARDIPVVAQKSIIGHALGASNLMEIVSTITALQEGKLPPTINLDFRDPECAVNAITTVRSGHWRSFLKTSNGFSGIHSAMVFTKN